MSTDLEWRGPVHYQWQCPYCRYINDIIDDEFIPSGELECEGCGQIISTTALEFYLTGYADEW